MTTRYSCAFNGTCELDPNGRYTSEQDCLRNCDSTPDKDITYLILQYAPRGLSVLAPSDQVEIIKRLTGVVVTRGDVSIISEAIDQLDWRFLVTTALSEWVAEELDIPAFLVNDVLEARETGEWWPLQGIPEAIPFLREADQAVKFIIRGDYEIQEIWDTLDSEQLYEFAIPFLDLDELRYGDVVEFSEMGFAGLTIYDGHGLLKMVNGMVGSSILINDFPTTTYFRSAILRNARVWLDVSEFVLGERSEEEEVKGSYVTMIPARNEGGDTIYIYTSNVTSLRKRWGLGGVLSFESSGDTFGLEKVENPELSLFDWISLDEWIQEGEGEEYDEYEPTDEQLRGGDDYED